MSKIGSSMSMFLPCLLVFGWGFAKEVANQGAQAPVCASGSCKAISDNETEDTALIQSKVKINSHDGCPAVSACQTYSTSWNGEWRGCSWVALFGCAGSPGILGLDHDDGTDGYKCCCECTEDWDAPTHNVATSVQQMSGLLLSHPRDLLKVEHVLANPAELDTYLTPRFSKFVEALKETGGFDLIAFANRIASATSNEAVCAFDPSLLAEDEPCCQDHEESDEQSGCVEDKEMKTIEVLGNLHTETLVPGFLDLRTTGKYFNFEKEANQDFGYFGNVKQCRLGLELWSGSIVTWDDKNGGAQAGSAHGRVHPIQEAVEDQWEPDDVIVKADEACPVPEPIQSLPPLGKTLKKMFR